MPSLIVPKALEPNATIAWISPSERLNDDFPAVMARATAVLTDRGYKVRTFFNKDQGIQSSINNRLSEIRAAFSDPSISAIFSTIGGSSLNELIPDLIADTELHKIIRANPKIFVGYSDNTWLHWFFYAKVGLRTFYGPGAIPELGEPNHVNDEDSPLAFCVKHLFRAIGVREPLGEIPRSLTYAPKLAPFWADKDSTEPSELVKNQGWTWLRPGKAQGRLFGGCLTVVVRVQGVLPIVPDWRGRIVFLETAMGDLPRLPVSRVRAAFADLIAYGVFDEVAGLVVGRPYGYDSAEERESYADVIRGLLCEGRMAKKKFPILFSIDIGHTIPMVTLPFDALAELDSENDRFAVLESGVE